MTSLCTSPESTIPTSELTLHHSDSYARPPPTSASAGFARPLIFKNTLYEDEDEACAVLFEYPLEFTKYELSTSLDLIASSELLEVNEQALTPPICDPRDTLDYKCGYVEQDKKQYIAQVVDHDAYTPATAGLISPPQSVQPTESLGVIIDPDFIVDGIPFDELRALQRTVEPLTPSGGINLPPYAMQFTLPELLSPDMLHSSQPISQPPPPMVLTPLTFSMPAMAPIPEIPEIPLMPWQMSAPIHEIYQPFISTQYPSHSSSLASVHPSRLMPVTVPPPTMSAVSEGMAMPMTAAAAFTYTSVRPALGNPEMAMSPALAPPSEPTLGRESALSKPFIPTPTLIPQQGMVSVMTLGSGSVPPVARKYSPEVISTNHHPKKLSKAEGAIILKSPLKIVKPVRSMRYRSSQSWRRKRLY